MPTVQVNGIEIYYERHGEGPPLLWIHGLGGNITEIPYLVESYRSHFEFIVYDQRGCGRSGKPEGPYSMAEFANDAAAFLDAIGVDAAMVYGSSMGGMVAQEFVLRHPQRVRGLILGCTTAGPLRGVRPSDETLQRMARILSMTGDEGLQAGWELGYSRVYIEANRETLLERARAAGRYAAPRDSYIRQVQAAALHDTYDRLGDIRCPVLIIHGEDDVMMPVENAWLLAKGIPQAELHVFAGMGHGYNLEAQAQADALVIDFCRRVCDGMVDAAAVEQATRALR